MKNLYISFDLDDVKITVSKTMSLKKHIVDVADSALKLHKHYYWEMFFLCSEDILFHTANGTTIYPKGSVLIVPPDFLHYADDFTSTVSFTFEKRKMENGNSYDKFKQIFKVGEVNFFQDPIYQLLWEEIKDYLFSNKEQDELRAKHALALVFLKILSAFDNAEDKLKESSANSIYLIDTIINSKFGENITLSQIAKETFLSERQISRLISKHYKCTFPTLLRKRRLDVASCLLRDTQKSIDEIRQIVGFESESGFFVSFKSEYGVTPFNYRKSFKKEL